MAWSVALTVVLIVASPPTCAAPFAEEDLRVEKMVMLMRHGIGSGSWVNEMDQRSGRILPDFNHVNGRLTAHGADALIMWGQYYRRLLASRGLLPELGALTGSLVSAFASPRLRSQESADAFLEGLSPGSVLPVSSLPTQSWFMPAMDGLTNVNRDAIDRAVIGGLGMPLEAAQARYRVDMEAVEDRYGLPRGKLSQLAWNIRIDEGGLRIAPLELLNHMVETLRTRYIGNQRVLTVGQANEEPTAHIAQLLRLREVNFDAVRHPRFLAVRQASPLLARLTEAILARPNDPGIADPAVALYIGSDLNIAPIRALLGFHWETREGMRNDIVPGGMLMLERVRHLPSGERFLRIRYHAPTMDQLRHLHTMDDGNPPFSAVFEPPAEFESPGANLIPLRTFSALVANIFNDSVRNETGAMAPSRPSCSHTISPSLTPASVSVTLTGEQPCDEATQRNVIRKCHGGSGQCDTTLRLDSQRNLALDHFYLDNLLSPFGR